MIPQPQPQRARPAGGFLRRFLDSEARQALSSKTVQLGLIAIFMCFTGVLLTQTSSVKWLLLLACGVLLVLLYMRRRQIALLGPLFWWELPRLARHGWPFYLRCGYALLLLGSIAWMHVHWQAPRTAAVVDETFPNELARLAERFVLTMLVVQNVALYLITPIYVGSSLLEERRRGSLDFLFTTSLTDREIVLGKLMSRVAMLALVLASGLPIYFLIQLLGGIDAYMILGGLGSSLITVLFVASVSLYCAATSKNLVGVVIQTLLITAATQLCCFPVAVVGANSPFAFLSVLDERLQGRPDYIFGPSGLSMYGVDSAPRWSVLVRQVCYFAGFHGLLIVLFVVLTIRKLRRTALPAPQRQPQELALSKDPFIVRRPVLRDDMNPLFWKERWFFQEHDWFHRISQMLFGLWVLILIAVVPSTLIMALQNPTDLNWVLRAFNSITFVSVVLSVTFALATTVSRERERNTLETLLTLLTLPAPRPQLLWCKWLAVLHEARWSMVFMAGLWLLGLGVSAAEPARIAALALMWCGYLLLLTGYALWLSVLCPTSTHAVVTLGVTLLVWWLGALVLLPPQGLPQYVAFNPLGCFWYTAKLTGNASIFESDTFRIALGWEVLLPHVLFAVVGLLFYGAALRRFCRMPLRIQ